MSFEVNTLFLLTVDVEVILGLLLLLVWLQNPRVQAVAWWASAHLMRATSVMLYGLYGSVPDLISIDLANRDPVLVLRRDMERRTRFQWPALVAGFTDRGRRNLAARVQMAGLRSRVRSARSALGDDHRGIHLAHCLRILARA